MEAAGKGSPARFEEFITAAIHCFTTQDNRIEELSRAMKEMTDKVSELTQAIQQLSLPTAPPAPSVPPTPPVSVSRQEPKLSTPEKYAGDPEFCRPFLSQCALHFFLQPQTYTTEESKVGFVLSLLTGRAALWGTAVWKNHDPCTQSFESLSTMMKKVFDRSAVGRDAARKLTDLRQGNRSVSDYAIEFRTLAADTHWNEEAQWDTFLHGLTGCIQRELQHCELPSSLNGVIDAAI